MKMGDLAVKIMLKTLNVFTSELISNTIQSSNWPSLLNLVNKPEYYQARVSSMNNVEVK